MQTTTRRNPRMPGGVTILTLLAMVACIAAAGEAHAASARRDARAARIFACHEVGERLVIVAVASVRPEVRTSPQIGTPARVAISRVAGVAITPLRAALLDLPPPAC
ncbi:MAG: hypothetical protein ACF8QF_04525 [Phycisphaerales bacterium]